MGDRVTRYHREHGAHIFDSDNLPLQSDGWFDSPKKADLLRIPQPIAAKFKPPVQPEPATKAVRYHRELGSREFDSDQLPSEADGWFDSPKKAAASGNEAMAGVEPNAPAAFEPDPELSKLTFNEYMSRVVGQMKQTQPDLAPIYKANVKKEALMRYARGVYNLELDGNLRLPDLARMVEDAEAQGNARTAGG